MLHHPRNYLLVAVLAVIAALMGPEWARPAVGGITLRIGGSGGIFAELRHQAPRRTIAAPRTLGGRTWFYDALRAETGH